jgi:hypothetical protein
LPHGHSLLHDYLVFAAVLVPKISYFVPELGYECVTVGVYPFVYPSVQVDVHPSVLALVVLKRAASDAFTDGPLGNPESASRFLDSETVYLASIPCVHIGDTRRFGPRTKALRAKPKLDMLNLGSK